MPAPLRAPLVPAQLVAAPRWMRAPFATPSHDTPPQSMCTDAMAPDGVVVMVVVVVVVVMMPPQTVSTTTTAMTTVVVVVVATRRRPVHKCPACACRTKRWQTPWSSRRETWLDGNTLWQRTAAVAPARQPRRPLRCWTTSAGVVVVHKVVVGQAAWCLQGPPPVGPGLAAKAWAWTIRL